MSKNDKKNDNPKDKEKEYVFRASMTIDGKTYYAKNYGKKAFKIPIN